MTILILLGKDNSYFRVSSNKYYIQVYHNEYSNNIRSIVGTSSNENNILDLN